MHYDVFSSVIFMDGMVYHPNACYTASFSIRGVWNIWVDQNGNRCYNGIIQMDKGEIKMIILINGKIYDSTKVPVLLVFDENEKEMFNGMNRFVSAPENTTVEEREKLINSKIEKYQT